MKIILVSLISDQTIPNLQFIKEKQVDGYLFVSTEEMNKKGTLNWLLSTSKIEKSKSIDSINVNPFSYEEITSKLLKVVNDEDHYMVNLTGGTKIMSLAVNDFFKGLNAELFYLTGKNEYIKIYPGRYKPVFELQTKITLEEYLNAHGFVVKSKGSRVKSLENSSRLLDYFLNRITKNDFEILEKLRIEFRGKKLNNIDEIPGLSGFLNTIQFEMNENNSLDKYEIKYLTGEWLEEYAYQIIKDKYKLSEDEIGMGWQIEKEAVPNEFDILYIKNNQLNTIECKSSIYLDLDEKRTIIGETTYKSDSLKNKFGLFCSTTILTVSDLKNVKQNDLNRAEANKIKVLGKAAFVENSILL